MGLIHHLADGFVVASLEGVADVEHPLHFTYHIFRTEEVFLGDEPAHFLEPYALGVAEELDFGMVAADGGGGVLAGFAPLVVGGRCQFVLYARVDENQFIPFWIEGEVFVFQRFAVEAYELFPLAEDACELVHDAALDAAVVVLGALAYLCQFELVDAVLEEFVDGKGEAAFEGCGGRKARSQGDIACENAVETLDGSAALRGFAADAEYVPCPLLIGFIFLGQSENGFLVIVEGIGPDGILAIRLDFRNYAFVDGPRENITAVVVGMFPNQVDTAGGRENPAAFSVELGEFLVYPFLHGIGVLFVSILLIY